MSKRLCRKRSWKGRLRRPVTAAEAPEVPIRANYVTEVNVSPRDDQTLDLTQEILPRGVSAGCRYFRQSRYDVVVGGGRPIMKASALRSSMLPCHAERIVEDGGVRRGVREVRKNASCKRAPVESTIGW